MRLMGEGKDAQTIRAYIDAEYSQYGPPTDTEPLQEGRQSNCSEPIAGRAQATAACGDDFVGTASLINIISLPPITVPAASSEVSAEPAP